MKATILARSLASGEPRWRWLLLGLPLVVGWVLVLVSLQAVLDFRVLFSGEERWLREDLAVVYREVGLADTLGARRAFLREEDFEALREHPAVNRLSAVGRNNFPAAVRVGGGFLPEIYTEVFFEALPREFFEAVPAEWDWQPGAPRVPVLVPGQFLHLYNFGFAPGKGLPQISPSMAKRVGLQIEVEVSRWQLETFPARIVGFSEQISSLHVPWEFLEWANATFGGDREDLLPSRAVLTFGEGNLASLNELLEKRGLRLDESSRKTARLQTLIVLGIFSLLGIGLLVGILSVLLAFGAVEQRLAACGPELRRLFFLGFARGRVTAHLVIGQLAAFTFSMLLSLSIAYAIKQWVAGQFAEGGFVPPAGLAGSVYMLALGLWLLAVLWSWLRVQQQLKRFV